MGLFRKHRHKPLTDRQEKLAGKVASAILRQQMQVAGYLNRKTQYWNKISKITALVLFSLVFGGISLYLLIKAIY
jgi:hypothetical protein